MPRTAKSQISFADWELLRQGLSLEPFLQTISDFLEDHEEMIEAVRRDLQRGLKNPETGRNGLTPSQVLRSFVLKSVKSWDLRELRERIADGYTLRQFTEFYCQPVPKHHAFNRAFHRLTPETVKAINELWWTRRWISAWKMATDFAWIPLPMLRHCAIPRYVFENIDCWLSPLWLCGTRI